MHAYEYFWYSWYYNRILRLARQFLFYTRMRLNEIIELPISRIIEAIFMLLLDSISIS